MYLERVYRMNQNIFIKLIIAAIFSLPGYFNGTAHGQVSDSKKFKKASGKIERGFEKNNIDTLAQGFFDLGEIYYQQGELTKSESYYQRSKMAFEKMENAEGVAKSSRALAKVQEELQKNKEAIINYQIAEKNTWATGDSNSTKLNRNDIGRLLKPDSFLVQEKLIQDNIDIGLKNKDTNEVVINYSKMAALNLRKQNLPTAITAFDKAYSFSKKNPSQALYYNGIITDIYLKDKKFDKAIEAKKQIISEPFVQNSSQLKASEITSLADIYIQKKENLTAIGLLNESYAISVKNGHTLEAKKCIEKLDSIFQRSGKKEMSLKLYKIFLAQLPNIISKDSSLTDTKFIAETEEKLKKLETEKALKDDLLRKKNIFTYWLIGSIIILSIFTGIILFILNKLKIRNKKIALQSLRREMNPHFIFNSLNSINQFIANNNELEANQYLTKFSTLMRRVMENSKEDFVLFSKEVELLQNYLELEKSRFTDKFDFELKIDDTLYAEEQLYIPGMLIQPHLENAIWHGLRYINNKGFLKLHFTKKEESIIITIEDNGIGIAESKNIKSANQQKQSGRSISNTMERIKILNELYHQRIICLVEDKIAPDHGVIVHISVPILKSIQHDH